MSAAAAAANATPAKGKKKLLVLLAAALLLVLLAGGAVWWLLQKNMQADDEDEDTPVASERQPHDPKALPTFVALDVFTVNLADRDGERYAQIGITLEVDDGKVAEQLKAYMPAIRNNILMVLAHKTAGELLTRDGKLKLAAEIRRESLRPLGIEVEDEDAAAASDDERARRNGKRRAAPHVPVRQVHFANFIIQ